MTQAKDIVLTERAARRISEIVAGEPAGTMLRVAVEGGGCSGFQYRYDLTQTRESDDFVIEKDGATVLIDSISVPYLVGSAIDFEVSLMGAHFKIDNPNAVSSCGCGTSFSL